MKRKLLIAGGCSYTDAKFLSLDKNVKQQSWAMWPKYLGRDLGLKVINTGHCGVGNETIFHSVMEQILMYKNRVDTVAIAWTEFDRHRFFGVAELMPLSETIISLSQNPLHPDGQSADYDHRAQLGIPNLMQNFFSSKKFHSFRDQYMKTVLHDSFRYILMMAEYCKAHGIKYIFSAALDPLNTRMYEKLATDLPMCIPPGWDKFPPFNRTEEFNFWCNNPFFSALEKNHVDNLIGWPFKPLYGGYTIDSARYGAKKPFDLVQSYAEAKRRYDVSDKDFHPNEEAQQLIGKMYYDKFKEIYK